MSVNYKCFADYYISRQSDAALYEILNLRTKTAQHIINSEKSEGSKTIYHEYLENWKEVVELMAFEDEKRYESYINAFNARVDRLKEQANMLDTSYNILLGEICAHAGMANVMYGDYFAGFGKIMKANKHAKRNVKKYPEYWLNDKLYGILNVSLDQMPSVLKWIASVFGLVGDSTEGYARLDRYLNNVQTYPGLKSEIMLYYAFALKLSKKEYSAYELFKKELDTDNAPILVRFLQANIMYNTARNEEALDALGAIPRDEPEIPFHHLNYLKGKSKQRRLDDDANAFLLKFLEGSNFRNYKREVSMRLAYYYFLRNDGQKYQHYKELVRQFPKADTDRDREADIENARPYDPHPDLLKARFLTNGGHYERAKRIMEKVICDELTGLPYQVEYYLLLAKINLGIHEYDKTILNCKKAMTLGRDLDEHYAAEAALVAGYAANRLNDAKSSVRFLKMSLEIDGKHDVYIENIHKRAKNKLRHVSEFAGSAEKNHVKVTINSLN
jgi:tetratricopeptide (TPR) repeat protein